MTPIPSSSRRPWKVSSLFRLWTYSPPWLPFWTRQRAPTRSAKRSGPGWISRRWCSTLARPRKCRTTLFTFDDYQAGQAYVFTNGTVGFWPQEPAHLGTCTFVFNASLPFLFLTSFSLTRMHTHHFPTFSLPHFLPPTSRHSREALEDCHVLRPRRSRHKHAATMGTL